MIFSLVLASVLVDQDNPLMVLTNLQRLPNLNLEEEEERVQPLRFVVIGDREKKDIRPILERMSEEALPGKPIGTLRLITDDHKEEDRYWMENSGGKKCAHLAAWSPTQLLILLSDMSQWGQPLEYNQVPSILNQIVFHKDGLDDACYDAMLWGRGNEKVTYSLINLLIVQRTLRKGAEDIQNFTKCLIEKLREAGKQLLKEASGSKPMQQPRALLPYRFVWELLHQILLYVTRTNRDARQVSVMTAVAIADEFEGYFADHEAFGLEFQIVHLISMIRRLCDPTSRAEKWAFVNHEADMALKREIRAWFKQYSGNGMAADHGGVLDQ